jgi:lysozyme
MMTDHMKINLRTLIVEHEELRRFPYVDTAGKITIGIGYNLTDRGISYTWINERYEEDVSFFYNNLCRDFPWFNDLDENRKIVLIDMCFMGYKKFLEFEKLLAAMERGDYESAALEILDSKWAIETNIRAIQDAQIMRTGILWENG